MTLQPGMEMAATFLETRRYCGMMGGTTEFTKCALFLDGSIMLLRICE
jgi:hypothetical protein